VSDRPTEEISEEERRYQDGDDPRVLDIIAIEMMGTRPHQHQRENHVIDSDYYWAKVGTMPWDRLDKAVDSPGGPLWLNGYSSTSGHNDRVPEPSLDRCKSSLLLIRPEHLSLSVAWEGGDFGPPRRRVRANFDLNGYRYRLAVTDPWSERTCLSKPDGDYAVNDAYVCVSLGEVFNGHAYKLAAAVITRDRAEAAR